MFYFVIGQTKGGRYEIKHGEQGVQVYKDQARAQMVRDRLRSKGHRNVNVHTFANMVEAEGWVAKCNLKGKE